MFLRNQPLVPYKKLTKILDKKPKVLRTNVIKSGKIKKKKRPKENNKRTTRTIGNYKVMLIMALKIKQHWAIQHLSNAAINDLFLAALLLSF